MSKSIKKSNKEENDWTTNPEGFSGEPGDDFRVKSRIITKRIKNDEGQYVTLKQKQVVYWSRKFYNREMKENESFLKILEEFVESPESFPDSRFKGLSKFVETAICQYSCRNSSVLMYPILSPEETLPLPS